MKSIVVITILAITTIAWVGIPATRADTAPAPTCMESITTSCQTDLSLCCIALKGAINNQLACFCQLQPYLDDPSSSTKVADLFSYCNIAGTFETLCPTTGSTTSPSEDITSNVPSTPSSVPSDGGSNNGNVLGSALGGKKNDGNKMTTSTIMSLIIVFISLMIIRDI